MSNPVQLACSARPRPSLQRGGQGAQHWLKDTFHVVEDGKTLCGRDATDYLRMEPRDRGAVLADHHLCSSCKRALSQRGDP